MPQRFLRFLQYQEMRGSHRPEASIMEQSKTRPGAVVAAPGREERNQR